MSIDILIGGVLTGLVLVALALPGSRQTALAQEPAPGIDGKPFVQLGIVVDDLKNTARYLSEVLGVPAWDFIDLDADKFENVVMHDKFLGDSAKTHLLAASGQAMGYQFELLQPVSGQSTHMEFLERHGEGIHHIAIAPVTDDDYADMIAGFEKAGIEMEMRALLGGAYSFAYLDTVDELGLLFEFFKVDQGAASEIKPFGGYQFDGDAILGGENRGITQIGIVVENAAKAAAQYETLLGIGPWSFVDQPVLDEQDRGSVTVGTATHEGLQFQLIQPASGSSLFHEYLKRHGDGIHHIGLQSTQPGTTATSDIARELLTRKINGVELRTVVLGDTRTIFLVPEGRTPGIIISLITAGS